MSETFTTAGNEGMTGEVEGAFCVPASMKESCCERPDPVVPFTPKQKVQEIYPLSFIRHDGTWICYSGPNRMKLGTGENAKGAWSDALRNLEVRNAKG